MKHLIYSVEDDVNISYIINKTLTNSGYDVISFSDSNELFNALEDKIPSLLLLDIMLPGESGIEILKKIRSNSLYENLLVIFISAKNDEIDKVHGLDLGADDYISKPFGVLELTSRINAHLRKLKQPDNILKCQDIILNLAEHTCYKNNELIILTHKEFELLKYLIENVNYALSREEILNKVWGYDFLGETRTLDMHIKTLRQKLNDDGKGDLIVSIRSIGYKIIDEK